jgi:hypothetical protein
MSQRAAQASFSRGRLPANLCYLTPFSNFTFSKGAHMSASKTTIGYIVQLGGIGAFALGAVLSFHHAAIAASFAGGAAAFYVGQKIRTLSSSSPVSAVAPTK